MNRDRIRMENIDFKYQKSRVQRFTNEIEKIMNSLPIKQYLHPIARFLLVSTFIEDSVRLIFAWTSQMDYLVYVQKHSHIYSQLFLFVNITLMLSGSLLIILKKKVIIAVGALLFATLSQVVSYGFNIQLMFLARNLAIIGALLMILSDTMVRTQKQKRNMISGMLPSLEGIDRTTYMTLAARIMLIFMYVSFITASDEFGWLRFAFCIVGMVPCIMVVVGFKAKWSATLLIALMSIMNIALNNWWSLHHNHPKKDFKRFDFFSSLSVVGGLLLLVELGPGGLSIDEKKKLF